jgi:CspA family cold shock protein
MAHGIVTGFYPRWGSGFISRAGFVSREGGETRVFLHRSQVNTNSATPREGDHVRFTLELRGENLRALGVSIV